MTVWKYILELLIDYPLSFLPDFVLFLGIMTGLAMVGYLNRSLRLILVILTLCFGIEVLVIYFAATDRNNHFLFTLTSLVEMVGFSALYWLEISYKKSRTAIVSLLILYLFVFAWMFNWNQIADFVLGVERFILVVYVGMYLHFILNTMQIPNLLTHPMFWVSSAILIYATGTFFIFTFTKFTFGTPENIPSYWSIIQWFTCLFYAMMVVAFCLDRREKVAKVAHL